MYSGKLVFSQLITHLPMHSFRRCVRRYRGEHWIKSFSCLDQYLCMAFAQLTYRESLRAEKGTLPFFTIPLLRPPPWPVR